MGIKTDKTLCLEQSKSNQSSVYALCLCPKQQTIKSKAIKI